MAIYDHIESFNGFGIEALDHTKGVQNTSLTMRLEIGYEQAEDGLEMLALLKALATDPKADQLQALIIGGWEEAYETSMQPYIDFMVENNGRFRNLKAVFFAEMTADENEISWIQQGNYSDFWAAYPDLSLMQIRGADGLSLGSVKACQLKKIVIETGGLPAEVLKQLSGAELPVLEHLELWLGDEDYGWDGSIQDVTPLLSAKKFPALRHLAIKNSKIQDDITQQILSSDICGQLLTLDSSMGIMTDDGAEQLLTNREAIKSLNILDVSENYLSSEMIVKLSALPVTLKADEQKVADAEDDDYRYVSASE